MGLGAGGGAARAAGLAGGGGGACERLACMARDGTRVVEALRIAGARTAALCMVRGKSERKPPKNEELGAKV